MNADGGQLQLTRECTAIERLDINQLVLKIEFTRVQFVFGQSVEHEGVVWIRAMSDANELFCSCHGISLSLGKKYEGNSIERIRHHVADSLRLQASAAAGRNRGFTG
jgi:hypothetical protein